MASWFFPTLKNVGVAALVLLLVWGYLNAKRESFRLGCELERTQREIHALTKQSEQLRLNLAYLKSQMNGKKKVQPDSKIDGQMLYDGLITEKEMQQIRRDYTSVVTR